MVKLESIADDHGHTEVIFKDMNVSYSWAWGTDALDQLICRR